MSRNIQKSRSESGLEFSERGMEMTKDRKSIWLMALVGFIWLGAVRAGEIDPKAVGVLTPGQVTWAEARNGSSASATIYGDPAKEGLYIQLMKWHPHHNSMPHSHPHDRIITVLSGTWWVGTGTKYDMESTVPMTAGTVVTDYGNQIHYDGAKDEECTLEIVGMGPATSVPAPK
jgi:quercetin dioxygenase-like cupin family protein